MIELIGVFLILTQKSGLFLWLAAGHKMCSSFRILPENCSISNKSLSFREAFLWASFCLSVDNHRAESAWTVTHLQECDLAMSWLPSGQSQGATWGLSQTGAQETAKKPRSTAILLSLHYLSFEWLRRAIEWWGPQSYYCLRNAMHHLWEQACWVSFSITGLSQLW